jgi:2,3-bisphosphoglycerate-dependent phosphoglycerate mutase
VTKLLLARHGETDWNREHRWQGHSDTPLNELGRDQARALADELEHEPLGAIYSSDLRRAYETAREVADRKGMDVIVDSDLREIHLGVWEGLTSNEIEERWPDDLGRWRSGDVVLGRGGETHEELRERVLRAAHRIAAAHPGEQVLVVSHGGALRALALHAEAIDRDRRLENCGVVRIVFEEGIFRGLD